MQQYLAKHGFESVEELDSRVQDILNGDDLKRWQNIKKVYVRA